VYPRIELELNRCDVDVSTLTWCTQLLKDIWDNHKNIDHFLNEKKIFDKLLEKHIMWNECPEKVRQVFTTLAKDLGASLSSTNSQWASSVFTRLLEGFEIVQLRFSFMENLFCYLSGEVLSKIPLELVCQIMVHDENDPQASLSIFKMRLL